GGMNLAKNYENWHDTMVRIEGPVVGQVAAEFIGRWVDIGGKVSAQQRQQVLGFADGNTRDAGDADEMVVANSPKGDLALTDHFFERTKMAKRRIWIETPFIGSDDMIEALIDAAKRNVDVRIVVSGEKLTPMVLPTRTYYLDLIRAGVAVYEYRGKS